MTEKGRKKCRCFIFHQHFEIQTMGLHFSFLFTSFSNSRARFTKMQDRVYTLSRAESCLVYFKKKKKKCLKYSFKKK